MKKKSRAAIADEAAQLEEIKKAHSFRVWLQLGPHEKYREPAETYPDAVEIATKLNKKSRFGRRSVIYAINNLGSFPVTEDLAKQAGFI